MVRNVAVLPSLILALIPIPTIKMTDSFPVDVQLPYLSIDNESQGPSKLDLKKELSGKKVVVVGNIGSFTPPCLNDHINKFVDNASKFKSKGVDRIISLNINDPFVNNAWGKSLGVKDDYIVFAQDPNAQLSQELGENYVADMSDNGLGQRTNRYVALLDNGKVKYLAAEDHGATTDISSAQNILNRL